jgi:cytosine permease
MLFITNNYIGFNQMVILNRIAFPILFFVGCFGIYRVSTLPGGLRAVFTNTYPETYSMATAITMVIGTWVAGCSRAADYFRFAKRIRDTYVPSLLGFFLGFSLCIICGAIWGAATGTTVIGTTLVSLNMVVLGAIMFFVQSWTTSEHCSYVTSAALPVTFEVIFKRKVPRRYIVLAVGIIGICITGLDIQNYYVPFISFLGYFLPVIGAIMLTDYFIFSKTSLHWTGHRDYYKLDVNSADVTHHKFNIAIVPAIVIGVLIAVKISWGIASLNSFFGSAIAYIVFSLICYALGLQKREIAKNETLAKGGIK